MKKIKSIYITILGSALALTTHDHSANAAGMSFEQCMEQYGVSSYCIQYGSGGESSSGGGYEGGGSGLGGPTVDARYAEEANQMRAEGVEIFRKAAQKTGDQRFIQLADTLARVQMLPGSESYCNNAQAPGGSTGAVAYAMAAENAEFFCEQPEMHTLLHETVHILQGGGFGKSVECDADEYMIKAFYYGAGRIQEGAYDYDDNGHPYCTQNIALERSFRGR